MNVTFYLHGRRRYDVEFVEDIPARKTVSLDISRITNVEWVSNVSCDVTVLRTPTGNATDNIHANVTHRVRGDRSFINSYIKFLAMKHGIPVRLRL